MPIKCDHCGKFCKPYDSYTPFGCRCYDPPEPYDPTVICKKCYENLKADWLKRFKKGELQYGNWQKSKAEMEAAKECGLIWIHSNGIGKYGTKEYKIYCYVTQEEYDRLNQSA